MRSIWSTTTEPGAIAAETPKRLRRSRSSPIRPSPRRWRVTATSLSPRFWPAQVADLLVGVSGLLRLAAPQLLKKPFLAGTSLHKLLLSPFRPIFQPVRRIGVRLTGNQSISTSQFFRQLPSCKPDLSSNNRGMLLGVIFNVFNSVAQRPLTSISIAPQIKASPYKVLVQCSPTINVVGPILEFWERYAPFGILLVRKVWRILVVGDQLCTLVRERLQRYSYPKRQEVGFGFFQPALGQV